MIQAAKTIDFLERAYDSATPFDEWRASIVHATLAIVGARSGGWCDFEATTVGDRGIELRSLRDGLLVGPDVSAKGFDKWTALPPAAVAPLFGRSLAASFSSLVAKIPSSVTVPLQDSWAPEIRDALGIVARDPERPGVLLIAGSADRVVVTPRAQLLLNRVSYHFSAALRLRRDHQATAAESAEAVLSPSGRVLHAHGAAIARRDAIVDGHARRRHAQSSKADPEKALEIWRGLISGRWSLVDHLDTDGKRMVLAMKNPPIVDRRSSLSPRERRVAALAASGHRDKEIAYIVGLSLASVVAAMHRARAKLGVKTRVGLVSQWSRDDDEI